MASQHDSSQAMLDFLLTMPEGRAALSAVITGLVGAVIRLMMRLSERHLLDRHELARLEQQRRLELRVELLKRRMAELGIVIEDEEGGDG